MALVMLMRTEKAKDIRKKLRREYFAMREVINSDEQLKAQLLLAMYNGGLRAATASVFKLFHTFLITCTLIHY